HAEPTEHRAPAALRGCEQRHQGEPRAGRGQKMHREGAQASRRAGRLFNHRLRLSDSECRRIVARPAANAYAPGTLARRTTVWSNSLSDVSSRDIRDPAASRSESFDVAVVGGG